MTPTLSRLPGSFLPGLLAFGFANPWLLWGLALGGVPILIHLLHRRAYRETDWAAMRFLLEAARKNSRRMRLEQLVLLAVRTLLLLFAALAFAEPLVQAFAPESRARTPLHRLIVIDASFSMGERADGDSRFDRARQVARRIVSESLAGDAVNVLRIAELPPRAVIREPAFERDPVLTEINRLQLTDEPGDLRPTLLEASEILADPRAPRDKEIVFISDFQRCTWSGDGPGHSDLHEILQRLADRAQIVLVDVGDGHTDNVAITSLQAADPIVLVDRPTRIRAGIRNFGTTNIAGLRVELDVDGYTAAFKVVDVPAKEEILVEFQHEFHNAAEHAIECRIPPDRLTADNQRWLSIPVSERMNVLIVNGREGGRPADNASHYVRTVLAPSTSREAWSGATQPKVINEADLATEDLSKFDVVFLCNVALVTPNEANLLQAYTEAGGGLVIALGDRINPENYNAVLYRDGKGVLPARLGGFVGDARNPARGNTFDAGDLSHPIMAPFRGNPGAGLERAVTLEYVQVKLPAGSPARVALRFDSGDPAIVERQIGQGRCVLLTTSADISWSTWPVHPTFPPIVHEMVRFAAQGRWHERQRLVGEPLTRSLSSREAGLRVTVKSPDGTVQVLRPVSTEKRSDIVFAETIRRGIYEMTLGPPPSAGASQAPTAPRRSLFAVNVDSRESDLEPVDEKTLRSTTLAGISYVHRNDWSETPREQSDAPVPGSGLERWLLCATLGLLLVDPLMAWNFRRGFALLCTLVVIGLAYPILPRNFVGAAIVGVLLLAGVVAIIGVGGGERMKGPALPRAPKWFTWSGFRGRTKVGRHKD